MMKKFVILGVVTLFVFGSCYKSNDVVIEDTKMGFIDDDLSGSKNTTLETFPAYSMAAPGTSTRFERSFENAPPLIPHSTEGLLPITIKNHICLSCHMPDKAKEVGSTPLPKAHFTEFRPAKPASHGDVTVVFEDCEQLDPARFNCTQCHVGQAVVTVNIENLFTPEFRDSIGISSSNFDKVYSEGVEPN